MIQIVCGDALTELQKLPDSSVNCCVTSPPYFGLRDYGVDGQIGLEATVDEYVAKMVDVFGEVRRVLRNDATLWLNMGDSYANDGKWGGHTGGKHAAALHCSPIGRNKKHTGLKPKDLIGIPWRIALALQANGWYLRSDIIWNKPNPMPESVTDRPTKAHEYIFLLSKSERYYYDAEAIKEESVYQPDDESHQSWQRDSGKMLNCQVPGKQTQHRADRKRGFFGGKNTDIEVKESFRAIRGTRNKRTVWTVATKPYPEAHFATYPPDLIIPCIKAGCPEGGVVLDPFTGSGTTLEVAARLGRNSIGIELNPKYILLIEQRCHEWIYGLDMFDEEAGHAPKD